MQDITFTTQPIYEMVEIGTVARLEAERDVYRAAIEGILDLPFHHAEVHNRYLHFVLDHKRMPTEQETMNEINCPALKPWPTPAAPASVEEAES